MTSNSGKNENDPLFVLQDELVFDILQSSGEEIRDEMNAANEDVADLANHTKEIMLSAINEFVKREYQAAKNAVHQKASAEVIEFRPNLAQAKRALEMAMQIEGVSMAARNEKASEFSEDEVYEKLQDLIDLGIFTPEQIEKF